MADRVRCTIPIDQKPQRRKGAAVVATWLNAAQDRQGATFPTWHRLMWRQAPPPLPPMSARVHSTILMIGRNATQHDLPGTFYGDGIVKIYQNAGHIIFG
jgi:hypothetical protein